MGSIKRGEHHLLKCRSAWGDLNGIDVYSVDASFCCPECAGETFTLHKTEYPDIKCRSCGEPISLGGSGEKKKYNCGVLNCGGGECVHELTDEKCPFCGKHMVKVKPTGFMFCSNDTLICDYETNFPAGMVSA